MKTKANITYFSCIFALVNVLLCCCNHFSFVSLSVVISNKLFSVYIYNVRF